MQPLSRLHAVEVFTGEITEVHTFTGKKQSRFLKIKVLNRYIYILTADVNGNDVLVNYPKDEKLLFADFARCDCRHTIEHLLGVKVKIRNEINIFDGKEVGHATIVWSNFTNKIKEDLGR